MAKVNIISGFLGAGKTTLIKKLLGSFGNEKVVLLENEYGEVGIDGGFMKGAGIEVTEMNSGCICCTLAGDFTDALDEILDKFAPDRIIIEPSGVGKLSDIRRAVNDAAKDGRLTIAGCATVADAGKCKMYLKNFGEFFSDQIKSAETVLFSRTQNLSAEKVQAAYELISAENPQAHIVTTPWDELDAQVIIRTIEAPTQLIDLDEVCPVCGCHHDHDHEHEHEHHDHHHDHEHHDHDHCEACEHEHEHEHHHDHHEHDHHHDHGHHHHHHHHHGHDADEVFENIGIETPKKFDREKLEEALKTLAGGDDSMGFVLRAKGILPLTDGGWLEFDYVPGEYQLREGKADYTGRLCVIGTELKTEEIKTLFGV